MARQRGSRFKLAGREGVNISGTTSYLIKPGDVIHLITGAGNNPLIQDELAVRPLSASWLARNGASARITGNPQRSDIDADFREDLIVEPYAR
jgi:ribosomal protein S4